MTTNRYLFNGKELENYTLGTTYLGTLDYGKKPRKLTAFGVVSIAKIS
ncbi:MAG: hypothetical protein GX798_02070 [Bacteroidales bacterium]|nr:hypothetical protein [Bacteroidales bacterium]